MAQLNEIIKKRIFFAENCFYSSYYLRNSFLFVLKNVWRLQNFYDVKH